MKITIDKQTHSTKTLNSYEVTVNFMDGDADGFNNDTLVIPAAELVDEVNMADFKSLLLTIERCQHAHKNGKGGYEGYEEVEGYNNHFGYEADNQYSLEHVSGGWCDDCVSSFDGWELNYYNEVGDVSGVTVEFDTDEEKASIKEAEKVT